MHFYTDRQTIDDLNLFGKKGKSNESIFALFNRTITRGGAEQLELMFRHPLCDITEINKRIAVIRFFRQHQLEFFGKQDQIDAAALYLSMRDNRSRLKQEDGGWVNSVKAAVNPDTTTQLIRKGIHALAGLLQDLKGFLETAGPEIPEGHPWQSDHLRLMQLISIPEWQPVFSANAKKLNYELQVQLDHQFRFNFHQELESLLHLCYKMDVYISVGKLAGVRGFVFPEPVAAEYNLLEIRELFHPQLANPVSNDVILDEEQNLLFLTGANMAGKSTFMKSIGLCVYLAHMGFPVPAAGMRFSIRDGLLTTINLADNLSMGFSHFYAEVVRVKKMVTALKQGVKLLVLIDELFRGTNVKDAHDATIAVASGFAKKRKSQFVISTHIMEAGEVLKERFTQIKFQFLPSRLENGQPVYPRKLETGISADRHGMIIIQQEGILQMLDRCASESAQT